MIRDKIGHHGRDGDQRSHFMLPYGFKRRLCVEFRRDDVAAAGHQHGQRRRDPAYVAQGRGVKIHLIINTSQTCQDNYHQR